MGTRTSAPNQVKYMNNIGKAFSSWQQSLPAGLSNLGLVLAILALFIYLGTLSRQYQSDGVQFALVVENENPQELIEANHLLYPMVGMWFYQVWRFVGWQGGALIPLQVFSAIGGALSVGLVYGICSRITNSRPISALIALGFGISHGTWIYSTDSEVVTFSLIGPLLVLFILIKSSVSHDRFHSMVVAVTLGLLCSLSIISYQTNILLIPVIVVGFLLERASEWRSRLNATMLFLVVTASVTASIFLLFAYIEFGRTDFESFSRWVFHISQVSLWGNPSIGSLVTGGYGFLKSVAGFSGLSPGSRTSFFLAEASGIQPILWGCFYSIVLVAVLFPIFLAYRQRKHLALRQREFFILATWGLFYGVFAVYWVPGDVQFWMPVLIVWWLLVGFLLTSVKVSAFADTRFPFKSLERTTALLAAGVVLLFLINLFASILPNLSLSQNRAYQIAQSVEEHTLPQDLIITTGGDSLYLYIPYFGHRKTETVLQQLLYPGATKEGVFRSIAQKIAETNEVGGRVFLVGVYPGKDVWWDTLRDIGVTRKDFETFTTISAWSIQGEEVREVLP
jgi:hypothetical protein